MVVEAGLHKAEERPLKPLREQGKLVFELCHFTQDVNPLWGARELLTQFEELSQPGLRAMDSDLEDEKRFHSLVPFFFQDLGFRCAQKPLSLKELFLPQVLSSRKGPCSLLMLLFCYLCEQAGLSVRAAFCEKRHLLRVQFMGRHHILDFEKECEPLESYQLVDLINEGVNFSQGPLPSDQLVVDYLNHLKKGARQENRLHVLSLVHSYLMRYQPFNLKHLSERATVAYETGNYKMAMDDIRHYFQYNSPQFNNSYLKRIYKQALKRMGSLS